MEWLFGLAKPALGARPISAIEAPEVLQVLRGVEARDRLEPAGGRAPIIGSVFRFAVASGRASNDPTGALRGALIAPTARNRAAIIEPAALGELLRAIDGYNGMPEESGVRPVQPSIRALISFAPFFGLSVANEALSGALR